MSKDDLTAIIGKLREMQNEGPRIKFSERVFCGYAADAIAQLLERALESQSGGDDSGKIESLHRTIRMMTTIMSNNTLAMQAAWIEWQRGEGAEGAMQWIENTLVGPGLIPEENEPHAAEAQAYFDANYSDPHKKDVDLTKPAEKQNG